MRQALLIISTLFILLFISCSSDENLSDPYVQEIKEWHADRVERLKEPDSWFSLAGLYWLEEGENTFGSDKSNDMVFPEKAPAFMGALILNDSTVSIRINDDVPVIIDSTELKEARLFADVDGSPTIMKYETLSWYVIKRSTDKVGVRLRDSENPAIAEFDGIEMYPIDKNWRVKAKYVEYNPPKIINIPSIVGYIDKEESPGKLQFELEGKKYRLDVLDSGSRFFVIFADQTNGEETYGAGRFITVPKPDSTGFTYIDFNKAYNPPCAFTKYATCPLPPKQNMLHVEITAGEKNYGDAH